MRLWFLGNGSFAASCFRHLASEISFLRVITAPPRPAGRGLRLRVTPVEEVAQTFGYRPEHSARLAAEPQFLQALNQDAPDALLVVDFSQLIRSPFLDFPSHGCLNIHPSLLPRYRGAAPVPRAILDGMVETGVTVFRLVRDMDAGPILAQDVQSIPSGGTSGELLELLAKRGSQTLLHVLQSMHHGVCAEYAQDSTQATYAAKILPEEARIDWGEDASAVERRIRALNPVPGAFTMLPDGHRLKIWKVEEEMGQGMPGEVLREADGSPVVACGTGAVVLREVQAEGRGRADGAAWWRGIGNSGRKERKAAQSFGVRFGP